MKNVDNIPNLSKADLDWMATRKISGLGGKILTSSQIRKLRGILKEKKIHLIVEGDARHIKKLFKPIETDGVLFKNVDDLFLFMEGFKPKRVGGFSAETKQIILSKKTSELVVFHEMAHLKHFEEIGEVAYNKLSKLAKESYVWKQILANRKSWSKAEIEDSLRYINGIRKVEGLELIKIKL